ncbi:Uncharacterised protein [Mycobacterium tuberculosis]|uniref:Uncharacterized protein n=1 Tax=Mycobacterium tuberculosis TaxID=1773 RepID=A0A916PCW8_MYCTX|nr:Uncharacterised protein [Mycobacterium tuberculosis]CPA38943.1 Uncharacterised protein [Mycobacterium tuberculosis]CPA58951.1 Uncharacterised protein [Mycobacterium tuberculosis]
MAFVVRPIPQRGVRDADVPHIGHRAPPTTSVSLAISSPTLVAAAVMMSRLPA